MDETLLQELIVPAQTKMVMLVLDGLGGLPLEPGGRTELETARTPHLDALAAGATLGLSQPVAPGVTVESGPGHLALFGYDPLQVRIGRGALEAAGIGMELQPGDVAARGNFASLDAAGVVTDRRAGRVADDIARALASRLAVRIEDVEVFVHVVREHRLAVRLRGAGLHPALSASDPGKDGHAPRTVSALAPEGIKTARVVNAFLEHARAVLAEQPPGAAVQALLLRGFEGVPNLMPFPQRFRLKAAAIAVYPTYQGIARLVGMDVLPLAGGTHEDEFAALEAHWGDYDFFYLHIKETDLAGEDGDFERKVRLIEAVDRLVPRLTALAPEVIVVTGDHSTPAALSAHSWHPLPLLLHARHARPDGVAEFGERACGRGSLGVLPAKEIMPLALAHAGRLEKWRG